MAIASTDGRVMMFADAAYGGSTRGVFCNNVNTDIQSERRKDAQSPFQHVMNVGYGASPFDFSRWAKKQCAVGAGCHVVYLILASAAASLSCLIMLKPHTEEIFTPKSIFEVRRDEVRSKGTFVVFSSRVERLKTYPHSQPSRMLRKQCTTVSLILATAVSSLVGIMMPVPCADAAFTPSSRSELQGDGGSTLGVFGCVGSCGGSLSTSWDGYTYCSSARGNWRSGTGNPCTNADTDVPSGQGTGKYETIGSWDVSKVNHMGQSKCILYYNNSCLISTF